MQNDKKLADFECYDETKPIRIWVGNLRRYNEGALVGAWLSLPMAEDDLKTALNVILGNCVVERDEMFLGDYECAIGSKVIAQYSCPYELNALAENLGELGEAELLQVKYLATICEFTIKEALEKYEDVSVYPGMNLKDVAGEFVDEGLFGEISEALKGYLDYNKIAFALEDDGYYYSEEDNATFFYP